MPCILIRHPQYARTDTIYAMIICVVAFNAIYHVWHTGLLTTKNTETPTWMSAFGGIMIGIEVARYGYVSPKSHYRSSGSHD